MWRRVTASALFGLGLVALTAAGQPPPAGVKTSNPPAEKKAADPVDALIAAALAADPDVQVARAKTQLAEAELAKARQAVVQKVVTLKAAIEDQKRVVASAEQSFNIVNEAFKQKTGSFADLLPVRDRFDAAKAQLARLETELKLMTGGGPAARAGAAVGWEDLNAIHRGATWGASCVACHAVPVGRGGANDDAVRAGLAWLAKHQGDAGADGSNTRALVDAILAAGAAPPVKGPAADRIRAALDKPIKLGAKDEKVTFEQALAAFKRDAGLGVPVRVEFKVEPVVALGEDLPAGAWLQLFADANPDVRIVVRTYGLLVTRKDAVPPDAVSVFDFWTQKPPAAVNEPKK